jgi:acyl carrier protein
MKIASFDIGIKNMAFCVFDCSNSDVMYPKVIDWNVLNLSSDDGECKKCNQHTKKNVICNSKAKYFKDDENFCMKHAKMSKYLIPKKEYLPSNIKKMKKEDLYNYAKAHGFTVSENESKEKLVESVLQELRKKVFDTVKKDKNANSVDLITIGINIKKEFDKIPSMRQLDKVIIENQISPIATRMKTIQGLLAQYFIMKYDHIKIEFISSSNKLKGLSKQNENENSNYKQHKKDAISHTIELLSNDVYKPWNYVLNHAKKDDLADAFLQGIQYIRKKNPT